MKKKDTKKPAKKLSKKDRRKKIETKLEATLADIKKEYPEKKFKHLVKKASKLFDALPVIAPKKAKKAKPKKAKKVEAPTEANPTQAS